MKRFKEIFIPLRNLGFSNLTERDKTIVLSFVVGLFSGFAAILLKNIIHISSRFLTEDFGSLQENYHYFLYPVSEFFSPSST